MKFWKKKDKGPYPKAFAKRLTRRIMLTLFITMSVVSLIIYGIAWVVVYGNTFILSDSVLSNKRQPTEKALTEVYTAAVNTVPDIENSLSRPDRLRSIMKRIVELNPSVRSSGLSFRENYYPQKGRWFCPYAIRSDSDSTVVMQELGSQNNDYLKAEWFVKALKEKQAHWSKPFFTGKDKDIALVAYLVPIRDERDSTVAVLGVDVLLSKLFPFASIENPRDSGLWKAENEVYFFAIDYTGTYLRHPDKQRIARENLSKYTKASETTEDDSLAKAMIATSRKGHYVGSEDELTIEGEEVFVNYQPLEHTPWTLALVIPKIFINVFTWMLGGFLLFFILLGLIVVYFAGRRGIKKVSRPLRQLAASADEVAKGRFDTKLPDLNTGDEIHLLRDSFENMQHSLTRYVSQLQTTTAQKASMESELKIAHDIQMSMLPKIFPPYPDRNDIDIYGSLTPAKGVGGDLFDFYIRDEKLFFCIGDVSGKGVPASLYMAVTRSLFRNVSNHLSDPEVIVGALNNAQAEGNDTNMFVTIFVGVLDLQTRMLTYCNAGHDAPILVGRDVGELPCDANLPIGVIGDFNFTRQQVDIDRGTTIFLFTDGLTEAENSVHAQFGETRIWNTCQRLLAAQQHQPQNLISQMTEEVHRFVGDAEQSDDLTMLAIRLK